MKIHIVDSYYTSLGPIIILGTPKGYDIKPGMSITNEKNEVWQIMSVSFPDYNSSKNVGTLKNLIYKGCQVKPIQINIIEENEALIQYFLNENWHIK